MKLILKAVCGAVAVIATGCGVGGSSVIGPGGGASELTAINISLPDRGGLKAQVSDIETKMNGYQFIVTPVDANCGGATKVDQTEDYKNATQLTASLKQGCDYDVSLALGNKSAGGQAQPPAQPSSAPSYDGKVKSILDRSCTSCHRAGATRPDLSSFAFAKDKGGAIINRAVTQGNMPPSGAMAQSDKDTLKAWADGGYLEKDAPAAGGNSGGNAGAAKLTAVYYKNNAAMRIRKEDIAGKAEYKVSLPLQLQADGRAIGLGSGNGNPNSGGGGVQPQPNPQPNPPAQPTIQLPSDRDFDVKDTGGKTEKLSGHFKGKYLLIDFSSSTCGYCLQRAGEMNGDQALQKLLDNEKCSHATVVPANDLSDWHRATGGAENFTGKHSYEATTTNIGRLAKNFGIQFAGTPTFLLVDQTGKVLADENEIPTSAINQYCK